MEFCRIGVPLIDKPYMAIDNHVGSPLRDRIYVTWTLFGVDGSAYIFESHSNNYGQSFSSPVLVSTSSTALCPNTFGIVNPNGPCNTNQFSQPFIGPDGALYVVYSNFNNAVAPTPLCGSSPCDNHFQILLTKSTNGGVSFSAPVRVGIYYDLPDCATYQGGQDAGRSCVPEKGTSMKSVFGAVNYPVGAVNPLNHNEVVVTFGSYINPHSKEANGCVPAGLSLFLNALYSGVKTAGACNNDILVSVSTNGGASFTGTNTNPRALTSLNQAPGQGSTDQWWQWAAFNASGKFLVSYCDRVYGSDETNASSDISLSSSTNTTLFQAVRVTSSSMPPPTQFTNSSGNSQIYGGYSGLAVGGSTAHPIWSDTRNSDVFICPGTGAPGVPPTLCTALEVSGVKGNDQDIFTRAITE